eukprot:CAMPEP_0116119720 /NCGR_PEP_ID=MMETSP0329-20121206/2795_1 /TAXON_ID=697910 /ORGANISM="Pseudo-nitzschia arenysensis, Strain B593" /LENGTH=525 /DNA_ID=CAMNT_0003613447 /DNA_START=229 /DNA_END=1806 /DNA_ORIENTATION=+
MPPPGEFGNPICDQSTLTNKCVAYKNGDFSQIPKEGYPVWVPSETLDNSKEFHKINIKREVITDDPEDPPMEIGYYINLKEQDEHFNFDLVSTNGTHITIPSYERIHGGYSKTYKAYKESETGIVTFYYAVNDFSIVANYPKVDQVQKYHTLTYEGYKDTARSDYIREVSAQQMKEEPVFDVDGFNKRAFAQVAAMYLGGAMLAQVEANVDNALAWQVRRFVRDFNKDGTKAPLTPTNDPRWKSHSAKAKKAIELAKDKNFEREFLKSELHCNHLEYGVPGTEFTVDGDDNSITLPLGVPVTAFTGETVSAPSHYIGFGAGTYTVHYDEENGIIQMFVQHALNGRLYGDAQFPGKTLGQGDSSSGMFLGPVAKGEEYFVDPDKDGRTDVQYRADKPNDDPTKWWWPDTADFTMWQRPYEERCEPGTLESDLWQGVGNGNGEGNAFQKAFETVSILKGIILGMPCSTTWMQTDAGDDAEGFDLHEITVWSHSLMEIRPEVTKQMVLAPWWNEWECFYQDKDRTLCH